MSGTTLGGLPPAINRLTVDWTNGQLVGRGIAPGQIEEMRAVASESQVGVFQLVPLVRNIVFLDGGRDLAGLAEVIITRAQAELAQYTPPDPTPRAMIEELWALHDLLWAAEIDQWGPMPGRVQDQRLMELLLPWEVRGSGHSQKVNFTYAELLYMQQKWDEAFIAFQNVLEERKVAFEPSQGVNRNIDWELGLCRYYAGKYAEAAPYFRTMANNKGVPEGPLSWSFAVIAFARSGQADLADKTLDEWIADRRPSPAEIAPYLAEIEKARNPGSQVHNVMAYARPTARAEEARATDLIGKIREQLAGNPRAAASVLHKERTLDTLLSLKSYDSAAEMALQCINAQPDRMDRAEYFLGVRAQALLGAKKYPEALAAAKSYYNACLIKSTPKAIELMAQALAGAYPDDPGMPRRFKLQQLTDGNEPMMVADIPLGEPVLKGITVNGSIYNGNGFELERNPDAQWLGQANMLLMQDKPAEAKAIYERLTRTSNQNFSGLGRVGIARAMKAMDGNVHNANEYIRSLEQAASAPATYPAGM